MNRVAVFGNAGGGKSTLSRRLAEITGLPLYVLDIIQFRDGRYRPEEQDGGRFPATSICEFIMTFLAGIGGLLTVTARYHRPGSGYLLQTLWYISTYRSTRTIGEL